MGGSDPSAENSPRVEAWRSKWILNRVIGLMSRVFANCPGQVIPKTQKMVRDFALLSTQLYEVRIKGKVEQSKEWSSAVPIPLCDSNWKGSLGQPRLRSPTLLSYIYIHQPIRARSLQHKVNFKRSLTGLNSGFSFSLTGCRTKFKKLFIHNWREDN